MDSSPIAADEPLLQPVSDDSVSSSVPETPERDSDLYSVITPAQISAMVLIGTGAFSDVYRLDHPTLGTVALKRLRIRIRSTSPQWMRTTCREGKVWRGLHHPHLLSFIGTFELNECFYLVCPYQKNGSLSAFLGRCPDVDRVRIILECIDALAYLHKEGVVHGDIKAANALMSDDIHVLICDFGLSRPVNVATSTGNQGQGSTRWMSPELLEKGKGKTFASDILSGKIPYHDITLPAAIIQKIVVSKGLPPKKPTHAPDGSSYDDIWTIIAQCWNFNPSRRPSMAQLFVRLCATPSAQKHTPQFSNRGSQALPVVKLRRRNGEGELTLIRRTLITVFQPARFFAGHRDQILCVAVSPDNRTVASGALDNTIRLWDIPRGCRIGWPLWGHTAPVQGVTFSPDGTKLVSGDYDGVICLWDVATGEQDWLQRAPGPIWSVAFSPDGRSIASACHDCTIRILDPASGALVSSLTGHTDAVFSLAYSPDGKTLISGSADKTARYWDPETAAQIGDPIRVHGGHFLGVALSSNGRTVATANADGGLALWDASFLQTIGQVRTGREGARRLEAVAFSPSGRLLATGGEDSVVRLWNITSGTPKEIFRLRGHEAGVTGVAFSQDGRWLVSSSSDQQILVWTLHHLLRHSDTFDSQTDSELRVIRHIAYPHY